MVNEIRRINDLNTILLVDANTIQLVNHALPDGYVVGGSQLLSGSGVKSIQGTASEKKLEGSGGKTL